MLIVLGLFLITVLVARYLPLVPGWLFRFRHIYLDFSDLDDLTPFFGDRFRNAFGGKVPEEIRRRILDDTVDQVRHHFREFDVAVTTEKPESWALGAGRTAKFTKRWGLLNTTARWGVWDADGIYPWTGFTVYVFADKIVAPAGMNVDEAVDNISWNLANVATHELGHSFGYLGHPEAEWDLMQSGVGWGQDLRWSPAMQQKLSRLLRPN